MKMVFSASSIEYGVILSTFTYANFSSINALIVSNSSSVSRNKLPWQLFDIGSEFSKMGAAFISSKDRVSAKFSIFSNSKPSPSGVSINFEVERQTPTTCLIGEAIYPIIKSPGLTLVKFE